MSVRTSLDVPGIAKVTAVTDFVALLVLLLNRTPTPLPQPNDYSPSDAQTYK